MISKIRNKWFTANFVLRHRWEDGDYTDYELRQLKSTLKLTAERIDSKFVNLRFIRLVVSETYRLLGGPTVNSANC